MHSSSGHQAVMKGHETETFFAERFQRMPFVLPKSVRFTTVAAASTAAFAVVACVGGTVSSAPELSVASLRLIGQQVLARRVEFGDTVVGGLSGID